MKKPGRARILIVDDEAGVLEAASDFDLLESQGYAAEMVIEIMRARTGWYDPHILEA